MTHPAPISGATSGRTENPTSAPMLSCAPHPVQRLGVSHRYCEAAITRGTPGLVFLAGMVPEDAQADITAQTADVLRQVDEWLTRAGSDKTGLLEATIYLSDMDDYDAMNAVWDAWVPPGHAPARACVQARLARPGWKVEIKATAVQTTWRD